MPEIEQMASCCGIWELNGLDTPPDSNLYDLWTYSEEDGDTRNIIVFTDNTLGRGAKLCRKIKDKKLGKIAFSGWRANANHGHGNNVGIWVWFPNWKKFRAYIKTTKIYKDIQERDEIEARYATTPFNPDNYQRPKW